MTELQQFEDRMVRIAAGTAHTVQHAEAQPPELAAGREHLLLAFERRARWLHRSELRPRLEVVALLFANARVDELSSPISTYSVCELQSCDRFPVSTTLTLGISHDAGRLTSAAFYRLEIIPVMPELAERDELPLKLEAPDIPSLTAWVERRLEVFVDKYLLIGRESRHGQGPEHTDPVCGMVVRIAMARGRTVYDGRTFHFCSEACQARFEAEPGAFAGRVSSHT